MVVAEHGIPSLGCEIGRGLTTEQSLIEVGTRGILNVLKHLRMLDAATPIKTDKQVVVDKITSARAHRGGLCSLEVKPGDLIKKGGVIATVTDLFGKKVEECLSPIEGYAITLTAFPSVHRGERIARIAAPEE
jgi:predicted deacylase